ncbi:MAG: flavoprotein, partial [Nanohaloarchaea archaeon QH_8_44_6]
MKVQNLAEEASDFTGNIWKFKKNGETVLIDAGTGDSWKQIQGLEKVDKVVITHSHYDHIDNLPKIVDLFS